VSELVNQQDTLKCIEFSILTVYVKMIYETREIQNLRESSAEYVALGWKMRFSSSKYFGDVKGYEK
jgi:hypothetical protein